MSQGLEGRRVLITGGARGLGAETARRLAARGAEVALLGLEPDALAETARACGSPERWWEADVTDSESVTRATDAAAEAMGGIDAVLLNAGIGGGGPLRLADAEAYDRVIEINLIGSVRSLRAAVPHLIESRGYALQVASTAAIAAVPMMGAYCASKSGVEAFARSVAGELRPHGVGVGVAYPIWHSTEMVTETAKLPTIGELRTQLPGPLSTSHPVGDGAEALVRGIEKRSRTVGAPAWTAAMVPIRGLIGPLIERLGSRDVKKVERAIAEHGTELTMPVGPGGRAGLAAGRHNSGGARRGAS